MITMAEMMVLMIKSIQRNLQSVRGILCSFLVGVFLTYLLFPALDLRTSRPSSILPSSNNVALENQLSSSLLGKAFTYQQGRSWLNAPVPVPSEHVANNFSDNGSQEIPAIANNATLLLQALWEASTLLGLRNEDDPVVKNAIDSHLEVPHAPHLADCEFHIQINKKLDTWGENGTWPPWILWRRHQLGLNIMPNSEEENETNLHFNHKQSFEIPHPPWVEGADEDNLPMTRRVQQDIWLHQHPWNCKDPNLRFLLADWERDPGFGMGAQFASMTGYLAIALNEKRILVTNYFNRADHEGCAGLTHSHWSCYFFPETSQECKDRALFLASQPSAWEQGFITNNTNYKSKEIWMGKVPKWWGRPWDNIVPTTTILGKLLLHHKARDRRWWRAQLRTYLVPTPDGLLSSGVLLHAYSRCPAALRYMMRFPSGYMCSLMNVARHQSFGSQAATMLLNVLPSGWPKVRWVKNETDMERFVWNKHKPWVPRPLLSIHVRQGDKAKEMKIADFQDYMKLAQQLRYHLPHVQNIWLSTEMQNVIEEAKSYTGWNIYYTNITRQRGDMAMPAYEASLGRQVSTNYPLVNFLMASDSDFFIGALGSTWCYLIDGMRSTSGKMMAGYLSVNKYRFW